MKKLLYGLGIGLLSMFYSNTTYGQATSLFDLRGYICDGECQLTGLLDGQTNIGTGVNGPLTYDKTTTGDTVTIILKILNSTDNQMRFSGYEVTGGATVPLCSWPSNENIYVGQGESLYLSCVINTKDVLGTQIGFRNSGFDTTDRSSVRLTVPKIGFNVLTCDKGPCNENPQVWDTPGSFLMNAPTGGWTKFSTHRIGDNVQWLYTVENSGNISLNITSSSSLSNGSDGLCNETTSVWPKSTLYKVCESKDIQGNLTNTGTLNISYTQPIIRDNCFQDSDMNTLINSCMSLDTTEEKKLSDSISSANITTVQPTISTGTTIGDLGVKKTGIVDSNKDGIFDGSVDSLIDVHKDEKIQYNINYFTSGSTWLNNVILKDSTPNGVCIDSNSFSTVQGATFEFSKDHGQTWIKEPSGLDCSITDYRLVLDELGTELPEVKLPFVFSGSLPDSNITNHTIYDTNGLSLLDFQGFPVLTQKTFCYDGCRPDKVTYSLVDTKNNMYINSGNSIYETGANASYGNRDFYLLDGDEKGNPLSYINGTVLYNKESNGSFIGTSLGDLSSILYQNIGDDKRVKQFVVNEDYNLQDKVSLYTRNNTQWDKTIIYFDSGSTLYGIKPLQKDQNGLITSFFINTTNGYQIYSYNGTSWSKTYDVSNPDNLDVDTTYSTPIFLNNGKGYLYGPNQGLVYEIDNGVIHTKYSVGSNQYDSLLQINDTTGLLYSPSNGITSINLITGELTPEISLGVNSLIPVSYDANGPYEFIGIGGFNNSVLYDINIKTKETYEIVTSTTGSFSNITPIYKDINNNITSLLIGANNPLYITKVNDKFVNSFNLLNTNTGIVGPVFGNSYVNFFTIPFVPDTRNQYYPEGYRPLEFPNTDKIYDKLHVEQTIPLNTSITYDIGIMWYGTSSECSSTSTPQFGPIKLEECSLPYYLEKGLKPDSNGDIDLSSISFPAGTYTPVVKPNLTTNDVYSTPVVHNLSLVINKKTPKYLNGNFAYTALLSPTYSLDSFGPQVTNTITGTTDTKEDIIDNNISSYTLQYREIILPPDTGTGTTTPPDTGTGTTTPPDTGTGTTTPPDTGTGTTTPPDTGTGTTTPPDTGTGTTTPPDTGTGTTTTPDTGTGTTTPPNTGTGTTTPPDTGTGTTTPPDTGTGTTTPSDTGTGTTNPPDTGTGTITPPSTGTGTTTPPDTGTGTIILPSTGTGTTTPPGTETGTITTPNTNTGTVNPPIIETPKPTGVGGGGSIYVPLTTTKKEVTTTIELPIKSTIPTKEVETKNVKPTTSKVLKFPLKKGGQCISPVKNLTDPKLISYFDEIKVPNTKNVNRKATRLEFLVLLINASKVDLRDYNDTSILKEYKDIDSKSSYEPYIVYSIKNGIMVGQYNSKGEKIFRLNDSINRDEASKVLVRAAELFTPQQIDNVNVTTFVDVDKSLLLSKYVQLAYDNCLLHGRNTINGETIGNAPRVFEPKDGITIAEESKILYNMSH